MGEIDDFEIPKRYGSQPQAQLPEQLFSGEMYQHKTRLYTTDTEKVMQLWKDGYFTQRCKSGMVAGFEELFDRSHILAKSDDPEISKIDADIMTDLMKATGRKSDRNNPLFAVGLHGGVHLFSDMATRTKDGWEAEHQHKVTVEQNQEQRIRHIVPERKRGFWIFGGGK